MDFLDGNLSPSSVLSPWLPEAAGDYFSEDPSLHFDEIGLYCSNSPCTSTAMPASSTADTVRSSRKRASPPSMPSVEDGTLTSRPVQRKRQRKSRAKPKAPITQLTASNLNFKDIVHQFTGQNTFETFHPRPSLIIPEANRASAPSSSCMRPGSDVQADANLSSGGLSMLDAAARLTQALRLFESVCSAYFPLTSGSTGSAQDQACKRGPEAIYGRKEAAATSGRPDDVQDTDSQSGESARICRETKGIPSPGRTTDVEIQNTTKALEIEGRSTRIGELHQLQGSAFLSLANLLKKHISAKSDLPAMISSLIHATE